MGPLHDPVTWYKIIYTGEQVAQWDFQNNATRTSSPGPAIVLEVPLRNLLTSIYNFVPCDRIVQRAHPHVLHRSAILFTWSCLHRKPYMTFFSLQQRNQVILHLLDRKESLMRIIRRFRDPRNMFFLPNGWNNLHG